jgi:hypothetical protein
MRPNPRMHTDPAFGQRYAARSVKRVMRHIIHTFDICICIKLVR